MMSSTDRSLQLYKSPMGLLTLRGSQNRLLSVDWGDCRQEGEELSPSYITQQTAAELEQYFAGERERFSVVLQLLGTDFQLRVWEALLRIPFGQSRSYGEIAEDVGSPRGARAVGAACHVNPIAVVVPCHRVVGQLGALTGYNGGVEIKERLLLLERGFLFGSNR